MPLCCPQCGNIMKSQLDKPNYRIHKKCHDCIVKFDVVKRCDMDGFTNGKRQKFLRLIFNNWDAILIFPSLWSIEPS